MAEVIRFHRSGQRFIAAVAVLLFPIAMIGYSAAVHGGVTGGFVLVLVIGLFAFFVRYVRRRLREPFLVIVDGAVECETVTGRRHRVVPAEHTLLLSNDWLGFRRGEANDIALARAEFRPGDWERAIRALRALPFDGVVTGPPDDD